MQTAAKNTIPGKATPNVQKKSAAKTQASKAT